MVELLSPGRLERWARVRRLGKRLAADWNAHSLAAQFLIVGGTVAIAATLVVSVAVRRVIESNFTRNAAASTALYVDSVIAPLLPDMRRGEVLDDTISRALDETLGQGSLGKRLFSFRLWRRDGAILYSNRHDLTGRFFPLSTGLKTAFEGRIVAKYGGVDEPGSEAENESGQPLLEIYNPVLQPWSGDVVAVSEFYEVAPDFQSQLDQALLRSWLAVACAVSLLFVALTWIVIRGSRTIARQRATLVDQVHKLSQTAEQNELLRQRVVRASQRTSELNEQYLRTVAADLHDGPAQLLALAALHLDPKRLVSESTPKKERESQISSIRKHLTDALSEVRGICKGLMLPRIEAATLSEIIHLAAVEYQQRTGKSVTVVLSGVDPELNRSTKIGIYRFVQETLNNGFRHAAGVGQTIMETSDAYRVMVEVSDKGGGFDFGMHEGQGMGLIGLRERIESLGGTFDVRSSSRGTTVSLSLDR